MYKTVKNFLIATTALASFATASVYANEAPKHAQPSVEINGHLEVEMVYNSSEEGFKDESNESSAIRSDKGLSVAVSGSNDMGLDIGGRLLLADRPLSTDPTTMQLHAEQLYVHVGGEFGKVFVGNVPGASSSMMVNSGSVSAATGGVADGKLSDALHMMGKNNGGFAASGGISDWSLEDLYVSLPHKDTAATAETTNKVSSVSTLLGGQDLESSEFGESVALATSVFWKNPSLFVGNSTQAKNATKIAYLSPEMSGLQVGVSYAPKLSNDGNGMLSSAASFNHEFTSVEFITDDTAITGETDALGYLNALNAKSDSVFRVLQDQSTLSSVYEMGMNYHYSYNDMHVKLGLSALTATAPKVTLTDAGSVSSETATYRAGSVGVMLGYQQWSVAGSYGLLSDDVHYNATTKSVESEEDEDTKWYDISSWFDRHNNSFYDIGLGYDMGPVKMSASYMNSKLLENKYTNTTFGVEYHLAKGMNLFAEYSNYNQQGSVASNPLYKDMFMQSETAVTELADFSSNIAMTENKGSILFVGTSLSF